MTSSDGAVLSNHMYTGIKTHSRAVLADGHRKIGQSWGQNPGLLAPGLVREKGLRRSGVG